MQRVEGLATVEELLSGTPSSVTEVAVLVREMRVRIGVLPQHVTIRIYFDAGTEPYSFEMSHTMNTGLAAVPSNGSHAPSEAEALRRAIRLLTEGYEAAVRAGQMPVDGWLERAGA